MKKLIVVLFVILIVGMTTLNNKNDQFGGNQLPELVRDVEFDTEFNQEDFDYDSKISREYSDDVGMSEWIGL